MILNRVLLVIPQNTSGGAERVMSLLANSLSENGIEVLLLNFDSDTKFYPISPKVKWKKMGLEFSASSTFMKVIEAPYKEIKRFFYIRKVIKEYKPDVVIPFLEMAEVLTIPNCILCDVPFIVSLRNDYDAYFGYMKLLSRLTYHKANLVVCQTSAVEKSLHKSINCNSVVIPNPIDESAYACDETKGYRRKIILNVGRLTKQKNQSLLIKAFARIADQFKDYQLHIYGKGELKEELQNLIDTLNLSSQIKLMGVMNNVLKANRDCSLFVMSSDYEGFPNTLVEAMANGIPVISTNFGTKAAEQIIGVDEKNGGLVQVGDEKGLSLKIREALLNLDAIESKAEKGKYVRQHYSIDIITNQWINNIEKSI